MAEVTRMAETPWEVALDGVIPVLVTGIHRAACSGAR